MKAKAKTKLFSSLFLFLLFLTPYFAQAEKYVLFQDGKPFVTSAEYSRISGLLKKDDVIVFSGGEEYVLTELVGKGNTTQIWRINKPGRVLRIPTGDYSYTSLEGGRSFINEWIDGHPKLKKFGGPGLVPEMYHSKRGEFIEVEDFKPDFTLDQFLNNQAPEQPMEVSEATTELIFFAAKLSRFKSILDFRVENIGYVSGRGWKFFDWRDSMTIYETEEALLNSFQEKDPMGIVGTTVFADITANTFIVNLWPKWREIHQVVLGALFHERKLNVAGTTAFK